MVVVAKFVVTFLFVAFLMLVAAAAWTGCGAASLLFLVPAAAGLALGAITHKGGGA